MSAVRAVARYSLWPAMVGAGMYTVYVWSQIGTEVEAVVLSVFAVFLLVLVVLERYFPYREDWHWRDGQILANLVHTLFSTMLGLFFSAVAIIALLYPMARQFHQSVGVLWPRSWPTLAQVILMVATWDFLAYWTHRWSHEWHWLWRVHAMHHDQDRVHAVNAGRVHILDTLKTEVVSLPVLLFAGVPLGILAWYLAFFRFIGVLSHANLNLRFGPLNYLFNTPEVHRWHHSAATEEGLTNYGQNFMVWDHLFRTYYKPRDREPEDAGADVSISRSFFGQVLSPFTLRRDRVPEPLFPERGLPHSLVYTCGCGARIRVKPSHLGRVWRCRACGAPGRLGRENTRPARAA